MSIHSYLPQDRIRALAIGEELSDRANGSALFADISGFTPLTEKLTQEFGTRRGIEDLAQQINMVYDASIREVERFGGSVVSFAGDAITCWFKETDGESAHRAVLCAEAMQKVMEQFPGLSVKIAVCTGPARRFAVGDPNIQLIDTLAGATITRLAIAEQLANAGEIILDEASTQQANIHNLPKRTSDTGELFSILDSPRHSTQPVFEAKDVQEDIVNKIEPERLKPWILPMVFEKESAGHELFLTELRPTAATFIRFTGIDYDNDPQAFQKLNTIVSITQKVLAKHEGSLLELTIGDKGSYLYISFGATRIHENDAQRAIRAALEIRSQLAESEVCESLQIGIASGTMRVGGYGSSTRKSFSALGNSVNLAARLMMAAAPGEILISSRIQKFNNNEFVVDAHPPMIFKGWSEPILVFAVLGVLQQRAIRLREPTYQLPMIGRTRELNIITESLEKAAQGKGQIIGITGEAGLGKSRLVAEGIRLARRKKFLGYGGECQSDGVNIPYSVWNPIWNAFFDLDPAMSLRKQTRLLEGELEDRAPDQFDAMPVLGSILGLSLPDNDFTRPLQPSDRKTKLETILLTLLESFAREAADDDGGILLVLEDLHWIDPVSFDLLSMVNRAVERLPILVLLTYRPMDPKEQHPNIAQFNSLEHFTQINLSELNASESEQAIRAKLAHLFPELTGKISPGLIARITNRSQGNPFYVEELLNYMHDRGLDPSNTYALSNLELPTSLHSLILSRIDHLSASQQLALKAASIIGRVFQFEHLQGYYSALGTPKQVKSDLQVMESLELTPQVSPEPDLTYIFKHLVTHEASYESIAFATRKKLHGQYAQYLENTFTDQIERLTPQLANHYDKADMKEKAQAYLIKAGEQAASNFANDDALTYFNRALKLSDNENSRTHFDILMKRERVCDLLGRRLEQRRDLEALERLAQNFEDALYLRSAIALRKARLEIDESSYQTARQIAIDAIEELEKAEQTKEISELHVDALLLEARSMFLAGQAVAAKPQLEKALSLAHTHQYLRGEYNALAQLGLWNWYDGNNKAAIDLMEQSLVLIREAGDIRREADILNNLGIVTKDMYLFKESLAYYEKAQKISKKIGDRSGEASLLNNMGRVSINSGDLLQAISYCNQAAVLAAETNDSTVQGVALHNKSEAYRELGQYSAARDAAEKSIKLLSASGYQAGEGWALENLAMIEFLLGDHEKALQLAGQALTISQSIASKRMEVSVLTRLGIMRLGMGQLKEAQTAFLSAQRIEEGLKESIPMFEISAGLAGVALAQNDLVSLTTAGVSMESLINQFLENPSLEENHILPMWLYLTCIRVLRANSDQRLEALTAVAHKELTARSKKITDDAVRTGFLKIHEHQFILAFASSLSNTN